MVQNIRALWTRELVQRSRNIVAMDGAIMSHPRTWEASGHVEKFNDPMVKDLKTGTKYRADHLLQSVLGIDPTELSFEQMGELLKSQNVLSPDGNQLSDVVVSSLMVQAEINGQSLYLRGETCQNIFPQFLNLVNSSNLKIPFGVLQTGKVFRNEVTARQFILRMREFEQIEFEYFIDPEDKTDWIGHWKERFIDILDRHVGLPKERLRYRELSDAERSHYAKFAYDLEFRLDNGDWLEMSPLNHRGDWDLRRHSEYSGKNLSYFDQKAGRRYTPHVIETSFGVSRLVYLVLDQGYREEIVPNTGENRIVLKLSPAIAPYKAAVLPLSNKPQLLEVAERIYADLSTSFSVDHDTSASIGKRYRRQDEIGTPLCITVDFETAETDTVTVRDRDTMAQERVSTGALDSYIRERLGLTGER
jgi:glycyl-tRNA synthetase